MEHNVTSNEFDAILNILEGLYSSINTLAIAASNTKVEGRLWQALTFLPKVL